MKKALDSVMKVIGYIIAVLVFAAVCVITIQIFCRYVFNKPTAWTEQTCRYLYVWLITLAIPLGYYRGNMLVFDMLLNALGKKLRIAVMAFINLLSLGFLGYYGYWSFYLIKEGGWRVAQGVPIKMGYLYAAQPVLCVLVAWVLVYQTVVMFKSAKQTEVKEA